MKANLLATLVATVLSTSPAFAATWNVYMPPPYVGSQPPPFNASAWTLADSYDDADPTTDCAGAGLALHGQYFRQGDTDKARRALEVVCVNQETGEVSRE